MPYPGISTASTKIVDIFPCPPLGMELESGKKCILSVTFQPDLEKLESGNLKVEYTIDSKKYSFVFHLEGSGKVETEAHKALEKLKPTFSVVNPITPAPTVDDKLIESVLAKGHSNKFAYDDYFSTFASKTNVDVLQKQLNVPRVIGYTFRADARPPRQSWDDCDNDWKNGFTLKDPITGKDVVYPGNPKGTDCGIENVGGFLPNYTRKKDIEKINKLLIEYKNKTGNNFNPSADDFEILKKFPSWAPSITSESDFLNWYIQSVLNLSAHVHGNFDYKGFISTSTKIGLVKSWSSGSDKSIYVMYFEGGYLLPLTSDPNFKIKSAGANMTMANENEVAVPGLVAWEDIMAYIDLSPKGTKKIMVRDGFKEMDPDAYNKVVAALSNIN